MSELNEQECMQDVLLKLQSWLSRLEERVTALLLCGDLEEMKPGEREQAISRHLTMLLRLLQLRQQYAKSVAAAQEQARLNAILRGAVPSSDGSES